jgi:hypothetical protein
LRRRFFKRSENETARKTAFFSVFFVLLLFEEEQRWGKGSGDGKEKQRRTIEGQVRLKQTPKNMMKIPERVATSTQKMQAKPSKGRSRLSPFLLLSDVSSTRTNQPSH